MLAGLLVLAPAIQAGATPPTAVAVRTATTAVVDPMIAAAGDIACGADDPNYNGGNGTATACRMKYTSDLLVNGDYTNVLTLGDNMQSDPSPNGFATVFNSTWGRVKSLIHPEAGNHDYGYSAAAGYYGYFGSAAGDPTKGYYSYDLGAWHVVELNSNCAKITGGCARGGAQELWLRADLAANPGRCTLAVQHHPRYSSGHDGDNTFMSDLYQDLYDAGADVLLSGHSHDYERFAQQDNAAQLDTQRGIRQFVVGTGGAFFTGLGTRHANSQASQNTTFGVLALTLHSSSYDWRFQPEAGKTYTDSGSTPCHAGTPVSDDFSISASPVSVSVTAGQPVTSTISTAVTSGVAQSVSLSASGLPAGVTASFNPASVTAGQGSVLTLSTQASTVPGSYPVTVTGTGSSASHSTPITLTVNPQPAGDDFSISASPSSVSVTAGQPVTSTISTAVTSGVAQSVSLSASGLPAGVTASFNPASVTAGQSSVLTLSTQASTVPGSYPVTVTGTGSSASHSTPITLTVNSGNPTTPQLVQAAGATETAAATALTATFPAATGNGHLLVLAAGVYTGTTNRISSVTDSAGNSWTRIGAYAVSGHYSDGELWYAANARPVTSVIVHNASAAVVAARVLEFSGVATSNPLDLNTGTSNTSTSASSGSVTSGAGELAVGFVAGHGSTQSITVTAAGFTALGQLTSTASTPTSVVAGFALPAAAIPVSFTGTVASSYYWAAGIALFRPATP
jgi:hypothetical protein